MSPRPLALALVLLTSSALAAGDEAPETKPAPDPKVAALTAEGASLLAAGNAKKARESFRQADERADGRSPAALAGWLRADLALGRFEEAARVVRSLTDLGREPAGESVEPGTFEALASDFRGALAAHPEAKLDLLWGLFDLLASLGEADEIARLAGEHLAREDAAARATICAVESRPSFTGKVGALAIGKALNEKLQTAGWPGPWLAVAGIQRPARRHQAFAEGGEHPQRVIAVVNTRGFLEAARAVGREEPKRGLLTKSGLSGSFYDPGSLGGRRVAVCIPFAIQTTPPKKVDRLARGAAADSKSELTNARLLHADEEAFAALAAADNAAAALKALTDRHLAGATGNRRAAVCALAGRPFAGELNAALVAQGWQGPFFEGPPILSPRRLTGEAPAFSAEAQAAHIGGTIRLLTLVDEQGRAQVVAVVQELPAGMTEAAIRAVNSWTYEPARSAGEPVAFCALLSADFQL